MDVSTSDYRGNKSYSGGSTKHQYAQSPKLQKARPGNEFLGLSRCAGCYNHNANSKHWRGGNGESSSSAEDSESEADCESEAESSSSSSCSEHIVAVGAAIEKPQTERLSHVCADDTLQSQEGKIRANGLTQRAPLIKSFSLPPSLTPHIAPFSLLPRPPSVVSTLNLQVLPEKRNNDTVVTIRQHLSERQHEITEQGGGIYNLMPPQPFQWQQMSQQHQYQQQQQQQQQQMMSHHYQQQLPQHFPPLSAQGQMLPPPPPLLPLPHPLTLLHPQHAPQTHLHALSSQPCWYCYQMHFPHTYWNNYSCGELPRW